jgi:hypothetical protein
MATKRSSRKPRRQSRSSRGGRPHHGSAYRPGLYGIHQGGLKNPAASKAERAVAEQLVKTMSKAELVRHLASITDLSPEYWDKNHTRKELAATAVERHVHAFNVQTDNYD